MPNASWIDTLITEALVRGAVELERTPRGVLPHRLPAWARAQNTDAQLAMAESHPSGIRVAFETTATLVELDVLATHHLYPGTPPRPGNLYDLRVDGQLVEQRSASGGDTIVTDLTTGTSERHPGTVSTLRFNQLRPGPKAVEIWLPYREAAELVALRSDAPVTTATSDRSRWVHHGSSISQGSDAASASTTWPALAAQTAGLELTNLGFSGSALLDPFMARVMRDMPAELISLKIGINLVNADLMRLRAFTPAVHGFLDTIGEGHPSTPTLVISPIWCPIHEQTPGPAAFDADALAAGRISFVATGDPAEATQGKLTLQTIRDELARIVDLRRARGQTHLHYIDGRSLFGERDIVEHPLADHLHPDPATHQLIGRRFADDVLARHAVPAVCTTDHE